MSADAAPVLIGDLGGTRARLALARPGMEISEVRVLATADFPDPATAIAHYLADIPGPRPRQARLAIATPVLGDRLRMTNAGWDFSAEDTRRRLTLDHLQFINDFAAQALALPHLGPGVYLCGGLLPRLGERFDVDSFRGRFEAKGRFGEYLRGVATFLVLHEQPGLLGLSRDPGTYTADP